MTDGKDFIRKSIIYMHQLTINDLARFIIKQLEKGNGDKLIVISDDNEGNGFHGLFYGFTNVKPEDAHYYKELVNDSQEEDITKVVILG